MCSLYCFQRTNYIYLPNSMLDSIICSLLKRIWYAIYRRKHMISFLLTYNLICSDDTPYFAIHWSDRILLSTEDINMLPTKENTCIICYYDKLSYKDCVQLLSTEKIKYCSLLSTQDNLWLAIYWRQHELSMLDWRHVLICFLLQFVFITPGQS